MNKSYQNIYIVIQMRPDPPYDMKYHDENIRINPESGGQYRVFLPKEIEQLDLEKGNYVDIEKKPGREDGPDYLKAEKVPPGEVDPDVHYKISFYGSRHYLTIPADWKDDFIKHEGKEQLEVEINLAQGPDHLRIYRLPDYYEKRRPYLLDEGFDIERGEPIILPFTTTSSLAADTTTKEDAGAEEIDLTFEEDHAGQKFRLILYDAHHPIFREASKRPVTESYQPSISLLQEAVEKNKLPQYPAQELRIEWVEQPTAESSHQIYSRSEKPIQELNVVLSEIGLYTIYTETGMGEMSAWLRYSENDSGRMRYVGEGWGGTCLTIPENTEHFIAYIPCQTITE